MSLSFSVVVLCPNGRRETVKISSNNSVLQVLEEACRKQKLNAEDFDLFHYKKKLDLSLPIRFANLPNNALLELQPAKDARKDCLVTIALQLESGERLMGDFTPASTLYDVLERCLPKDSTNLQEEELVCIYMRQRISDEAIKTTTLRSLGLTKGTAIIRLLKRKKEQLENQAHVSSPLGPRLITEPVTLSKKDESISKDLVDNLVNLSNVTQISKPLVNDSICPDTLPKEIISKPQEEMNLNNNKRLNDQDLLSATKKGSIDIEKNVDSSFNQQEIKSEDNSNANKDINSSEFGTEVKVEEMECDSNVEEVEEMGEINYIGDRHAVLYSLDDITDVKKADLPEEFFELTVGEVRYLMEEYKKERIQMENQPLLTKEQRERQLQQKFSGYDQTVIRVYFPEKFVLQAVFKITETVQTVCDFLREYLENTNLSFYLYTTPPKEKKICSKTLLECLLVPAAVVYFGCDVHLPHYLNAALFQKKSDPRAAALAASQSRIGNASNMECDIPSTSTSVKKESSLLTAPSSLESQTSKPVTPKSDKIPKWMKLSKK